MTFLTVQSEGSLISADMLSEIYYGEAIGQRANEFGLNGKIRLTDEIAASWSDARAFWEAFQHGLRKGKSDASVTREQWILPFLRSLGFKGITFSRSAATVGGQTYFISHRLGAGEDSLPIHIEGATRDLDKRSPTGRPRLSPHALLQEYLNKTEHLWGIVTNGHKFRILRDSARLSRPTYLEFDLEQLLTGEHFSEFQLFYRIVHQSRWPKDIDSVHECFLEKYYQLGIESGGRVRENLRNGVEEAIKIFGNGFLQHPDNTELHQEIIEGRLSAEKYYSQLLRLIYRFLFLLVSEERRLVGPNAVNGSVCRIYDSHYSISRFREKVERPINPDDRYWDFWEGVKQTFSLYAYEDIGAKMDIAALNGDLFSSLALPDLEKACLYNKDFLHGFAHLSLYKTDKVTRRINYAHLDVEELGSVYESLLDYHPIFYIEDSRIEFRLSFGTERKSTGSYYTRPELVNELVKSALVPVMEDRVNEARSKEEKEKAILSMRVCDPAAGSGHFLLAAARKMGNELAKVRSGEDEATPKYYRKAVRDVIQYCIYGVDLNPLAVELCKVALWLEGHDRGMPLTFLDHHIKCGNSLIGIDKMERLQEGIPNEAFKPVTGDDKEAAKKIKAFNRRQHQEWEKGLVSLQLNIGDRLKDDLETFALQNMEMDDIPGYKPGDYRRKREQYEKIRANHIWWHDMTAANIWTTAFFYPITDENDPAIPTHEWLMNFLQNPNAAHGELVGKANALAQKHRFFHWPLEFPEAAEAGGFDVVLGNPPWERIKLQELEFFAVRDPEIAQAPNKAARAKLINSLKKNNPALYNDFLTAKHDAESASLFVRESNRFPLTAVGDVNTYALFAEVFKNNINTNGRCGIIVPTGIATDDTCKRYFGDINDKSMIASLSGFQNKEGLFPEVHREYKFCLLTLSSKPIENPEFCFLLTRMEHLDDEMRRFVLPKEDLYRINPNTHTMPLFRTKYDAELSKKIYSKEYVMIDDKNGDNPWGIEFLRMFDTYTDIYSFVTEQQNNLLPVYEAKMIWQYEHRFGSYENVSLNTRDVHLPTPTLDKLIDPIYSVKPRYWVENELVDSKASKINNFDWFIVFRRITSLTSMRTTIISIIPKVGTLDTIPIISFDTTHLTKIVCLVANLNSFIVDFAARHKISGIHLDYFAVKQLPVLPPDAYSQTDIDFISPRVLELVFTAWDLEPFAKDMGYNGPPFKWDEERRVVLKAELDAYYAKLYDLTRDELRYILDPQDVYGPDFPGETFRVLKNKEIKKYGEYRTRRLVLGAWDRL